MHHVMLLSLSTSKRFNSPVTENGTRYIVKKNKNKKHKERRTNTRTKVVILCMKEIGYYPDQENSTNYSSKLYHIRQICLLGVAAT